MPNIAIPIKASTQEHLDIEDIQDDIVILKTGACSLIIQVTAINFGLLSEEEQDAIIFAYAALLNSLNFQIQILIRSNIKDVTDYIRLVQKQEQKLSQQINTTNITDQKRRKMLLLTQLQKYREFVERTVRDNQVLDKKFYICIPFSVLELGLSTTLSDNFKKNKKLPFPKSYILEKAKMSLYPRRDHLFRQFGRLGLQTRQLNTQQLLELFYNFYNLESIGQRFIPSKEYNTPIVQAGLGKDKKGSYYQEPKNPFQRFETGNLGNITPTGSATAFPGKTKRDNIQFNQSFLNPNQNNPSTTQPMNPNQVMGVNNYQKPQNPASPTTNNMTALNQTQTISTGVLSKLTPNQNSKTVFEKPKPTKADQSFGYDQANY
ncbi:hypothetical protein GYA19_01415 [Candidatus Beckwithbacteria bacterium]|nr:hypothetical protein [Candidatus Beckwithbacteria bacterium]